LDSYTYALVKFFQRGNTEYAEKYFKEIPYFSPFREFRVKKKHVSSQAAVLRVFLILLCRH